MALDEDRLLTVAGGAVFGRGLDYTRDVRGMRVVGTTATATIQAHSVYLVELDWTDDPTRRGLHPVPTTTPTATSASTSSRWDCA